MEPTSSPPNPTWRYGDFPEPVLLFWRQVLRRAVGGAPRAPSPGKDSWGCRPLSVGTVWWAITYDATEASKLRGSA